MTPRHGAGTAVVLLAVLAGAARPAAAGPRTYVVDAAKSTVLVHVGKSGAFSFAGHLHFVEASRFEGRIVADPDDLGRSSVSLTFPAAALKVIDKGEPAGDVPKVQEVMEGPKVLDVGRFPTVVFKSQQVSGRKLPDGGYELTLTGELGLHGITHALTVPVRVELAGDQLTASGQAVLRHTDFGMTPVSAGGGTVKVKNEIDLEFRIVARAQ